jgi:hypothetical protein
MCCLQLSSEANPTGTLACHICLACPHVLTLPVCAESHMSKSWDTSHKSRIAGTIVIEVLGQSS